MTQLSVILPVRNSASTIRACVDSILAQSLTDLELIVVGDVVDTTWAALDDIEDPRLIRAALDIERNGARRDANLKRTHGLGLAKGRYLALTDSDMTLPVDWAITGLELLKSGNHVVGGGMISESHGFVGRYVDTNMIAAKTPRSRQDYLLTSKTYGVAGNRPPITASLFLTRDVYAAVGGPDADFTFSYEDYEWARRMIDAGYDILMTEQVSGLHRHRTEPNKLMGEYFRSGIGCSDYIMKFPTCAWTRNRLLFGFAFVALLTLGVVGLAFMPLWTLVMGILGVSFVAISSALLTRTAEAALYPLFTALLGALFFFGMSRGLLLRDRPTLRLRTAPVTLPVQRTADLTVFERSELDPA